MAWQKQLEIILETARVKFASEGKSFSLRAFEELLGLSQGKTHHWKKGQRPSADDLQALSEALDLSPEWLLLGKGSPHCGVSETKEGPNFSAENAKGKLIGDLLWDIINLGNLDEKQVAKKTGIPIARVQAILASRVAPTFDELAKLHTKMHLDIHFLLTGDGDYAYPHDELTRIARATGVEIWDTHGLARVFGCQVEELQVWLKKRGTKRQDVFPSAWLSAALELYSINPAWVLRGVGKSHLSRDEVRQQLGRARGYSLQESHPPVQKAADDSACYPDPKKAAGDDSV